VAGTHDHRRPTSSGPDSATAWVVSPHLLVAQAVAAALRAAGAPVDFHAWTTLRRDVRAGSGTSTRHVVAIVDDLVADEVVDEVGDLARAGDVRVAVVATDAAPARWSRLLGDERIEMVTMITSIGHLAGLVEQFIAGLPLMTQEERERLRAEWEGGLDRQRIVRARLGQLSPQQLKVLRLLATGRRVHEVAVVLGVADGTVRSHVKALRQRIGARTQLEAVAILREVEDGSGAGADLVPRPRAASLSEDPAPRR
jgi:DNA-binding NarL/FixJ family response regulator